MYYVYLLQSKKDRKLYVGYTKDLINRIATHSKGQVKSTKSRLPIKLIFYESYINQEDALRRERYFKTNKGKRALKLMLQSYFSEEI
ncbi:GIY-YIG nuclease family protein [Candidatus Dojkabacteria bacterium]|uniref:GIY-YIG nuclease family protein n=1 Tax=Candidatus Dojkabacteria bacterium TaxID=2099670 RepID=A0A955L499_9BACT|nr:GIY-YIG nuclease family protein [Candidatus Dojkabacteria bacterium]